MPVIAKSDLFILVVSASLLAVGIYRWQDNLAVLSANAQQSQVQQTTPNNNTSVVSAISTASVAAPTTIATVSSVQTTAPVVVSNQAAIDTIVVSSVDDSATTISNTTEIRRPLLGTYLVVSGDYLSKIAQQFGTTVETLQEINNIDGTRIDVGQLIQFPLPAN